jgi:D-sedoheptulose 7-phosphate isomerase
MHHFITDEIKKLNHLTTLLFNNTVLHDLMASITARCVATLKKNHKILFAGNGGSAADSQHLAAELVSRLRYDRPGLAAIALTTDSSILTAIGNDYGYEEVFARQIESLGQNGDIFFAISTSGHSPNILKALHAARKRGLITIGFTGLSGGEMAPLCDYLLKVPSNETPKIQECHIMLGHIICALIEETIHGETYNPQYQAMAVVE